MKSSSRKFERPIWGAIVILFSLACATVFAGASDIAKWDPRMAASNAVIDTNGVKWIDGKFLPIEGRWTLGDTPEYYARLPNTLTTNVNGGVRGMRTHTSGMQFRFRTDSDFLIVRLKNDGHAMNHMTAVGTSGWDVYRYDAAKETWQFVASSHGDRQDTAKTGFRMKRVAWQKGDAALINLPLYNGVQDFELGLAKDASIQALGPRKSGVDKPVVFYGTSITHGGCASRPGLGFVNIVGRDLDVPVCCLGFSGSGVMEPELSDVIARIDASCYVLDCLWNMRLTEKGSPRRSVEVNYETFIRNLRAKRPNVPIVMAEQCDVFRKGPNEKDLFIRRLYEKLKAEDTTKWNNLVYLPKDEMYSGDFEGTVDGCHPNDLGMRSLATAFGRAVKTALGQTVTQTVNVFDLFREGKTEFHLGPQKDLNDPPSEIFKMQDGLLHVSGRGYGYMVTKQAFENYHLVLEFKWGPKTWGDRKTHTRDNGILYHATGPHGALGETWPASFEANIIQGGMGDLLVLSAKTPEGVPLEYSAVCEFVLDRDKEKCWKKGQPRQKLTSGRVNWEKRDVDWEDTLDFRGKDDPDAPVGEWNRLEVIARGNTAVHIFNGKVVNEAFEQSPCSGKICIQTEGAELFARRFELFPLDTFKEPWPPVASGAGSK